MENLRTKELTIEELTGEAMELLSLGLEELYIILGCQLMTAAQPSRVAELVSHRSVLRDFVESRRTVEPIEQGLALLACGRSFSSMVEELKEEGIRFVTAVEAEMSKELCGKDISELAKEISSASLQVIVLIVTAVLKLPRQIEAVAATVAAIFCKSGLRSAYA
jgi:hypothetical protein